MRQPKSMRCLLALGALACLPLWAAAQDPVKPADLKESLQRKLAMETQGLDADVARILQNYYKSAFGGPDNWARIESLRFEGVLQRGGGGLHFSAYRKKPSLSKLSLFVPGKNRRLIMAYDGEEAWQMQVPGSSGPAAMPGDEAINFIRDAEMGGHLLFPTLPGKRIEFVGMRKVDKVMCFDLQVTLPDGQVVAYAIDSRTYVERQLQVTNAVSRELEVTTHADFRKIEGVTVPFHSRMTVDGELRHEVRLQEVTFNLGVTPWFFSRKGAAYDATPPPVQPAPAPESTTTPAGTWGTPDWTQPDAGGSVFPDRIEIPEIRFEDESGDEPPGR